MKGKLIIILMVLLSGGPVNAAVKLDFSTVDMLTYRYYREKKWDSVIVIGKQSLRQDIDYYFLRVRMGIAYFEKTEYFPAAVHLKKARQFNSGDPEVANYLYLAYVYSNRTQEAHLLRAAMIPGAQDYSGKKQGFLEQLHFETGYTISSDRSPDNLATLSENDSIYGEQDLYGNSFYCNLGLKLRVSNRVGLTLAYNYLNFDKTKYIQYGRGEDHLESITDTSWGRIYNYSFPWVMYDTSFRYQVAQNEAYISATVAIPWELKIQPAFHWLHVSYNMINPGFHRDTIQDTAYYTSIDNRYYTFPYTRLIYTFERKDTSFNNYLASLRISKDLGRFSLSVSGSWSNLNGMTQKQAGMSVTWFPLGNLNLYSTTAVTGFFQDKESRLLFSEVLGARITRRLWGEANYYYGDYTNANIFNGSVVYNNSDIIDYRAGATLVYEIGKHIQLSLIYQYFRKESKQYYYIKVVDPDTKKINEMQQSQNNPYNTNTIIGGITWKL
jgi:hypothetical protein